MRLLAGDRLQWKCRTPVIACWEYWPVPTQVTVHVIDFRLSLAVY